MSKATRAVCSECTCDLPSTLTLSRILEAALEDAPHGGDDGAERTVWEWSGRLAMAAEIVAKALAGICPACALLPGPVDQ